ncbi:N-glycosyltransferase [Amycolatopsis saalfeldensis]|uniref:N-glycosyltransferase n=1 Tax=Amycolatopsis saalfeldensis TaxID=394193 RepID=A0A1H8YKR1_9PSEU|nr:N-glycosyltransferase [Amycolatopsis saalfeldensis]
MRVLLTGLPIRSHLVPVVVPVALALRRAGHEVAIATGSAVAEEISRLGVPVLVLPRALAPEEVGRRPELMAGTGFSPEQFRQWRPEVTGPLSVPLFNGLMTAEFAGDLLDAAKTWRPDVIVRETNEYGGYLAAEVLGLPLAVLDIAPLISRLVPDLTERLNRLREDLGLPAIEEATHASGLLTAGLLPEPWYPEDQRTPGHRYYRVPATTDEQPLDPAIVDFPADRPFVLAGFGSNAHSLLATGSELMRSTVDALGSLPVRAVAVLGSEQAVAAWTGPRPANVHLASFVPQRSLLGACDLFLTHAGFSGVREALSAGVPMVAVPLFAEQPENAARVHGLGLGVHIDPAGLTADVLAAGLERVLDEPSCRSAARAFQRRILGLPALTAFTDALESLV